MSVITDLVLITGIDEDEAMARVNAWCAEHDPRSQQFNQLDAEVAGGFKVFTDQVWAMSGNYFPWKELADALPSFGWRLPRYAVLVVDYEHDEFSRVFAIPGGAETA